MTRGRFLGGRVNGRETRSSRRPRLAATSPLLPSPRRHGRSPRRQAGFVATAFGSSSPRASRGIRRGRRRPPREKRVSTRRRNSPGNSRSPSEMPPSPRRRRRSGQGRLRARRRAPGAGAPRGGGRFPPPAPRGRAPPGGHPPSFQSGRRSIERRGRPGSPPARARSLAGTPRDRRPRALSTRAPRTRCALTCGAFRERAPFRDPRLERRVGDSGA